MEAVASTELDDAIFPQPPQDVIEESATDSAVYLEQDTSDQMCEVECRGLIKPLSAEGWDNGNKVVEFIEDAQSSKEEIDDDKKAKKLKNKSKIRRLFTGIRLKKGKTSDSSSEEDIETESELTIDSREISETIDEDEAVINKTAFTRIIQRVQTKANRVWEQIGQKLGGRADTDDDETEGSLRSLSISIPEVKPGGDASEEISKHYPDSSNEEMRKDMDLGDISNQSDLTDPSCTGKGKSSTLKRIASGIKSGLKTNKMKTKN